MLFVSNGNPGNFCQGFYILNLSFKILKLQSINPKLKRTLNQIIPVGIIWFIMGSFTIWVEFAVIAGTDERFLPESAISLSLEILIFASISVFLIGCLVGFIEVTFINKLFTKSSFPKKILSKFLIYSVVFFIVIFITYMLAASIELKASVFSNEVFDKYLKFIFSITNVSTSIQILFSLGISLLYLEISDNLGQGVLLNFFLGKYHKPKIERRIFMFTDMKDSTSTAEELGHLKYFDYLRSYYEDLSNAIVNNYGEVYQYVGDEIVISWNTNKKNTPKNSLQCFFDMKEDLAKKRASYMETYGLFPDFKAGIHVGEVTTGEIGALKKEIFFTGDVLNTTARIQGLCKNYGVDLLTSKEFIDQLSLSNTFRIKSLGETYLKGKKRKLNLYTIIELK